MICVTLRATPGSGSPAATKSGTAIGRGETGPWAPSSLATAAVGHPASAPMAALAPSMISRRRVDRLVFATVSVMARFARRRRWLLAHHVARIEGDLDVFP